GKALWISGSDVASSLSAGSAADQMFLSQTLKATNGTAGNLTVDGKCDGLLAGLTGVALDDGTGAAYPAGSTDSLGAAGAVATYAGTAKTAAIDSQGTGRVLFFGFPFETINARASRLTIAVRALQALGVTGGNPPP